MGRITLIWIVLSVGVFMYGCASGPGFRTVHQEYFTMDDLPQVKGKAFGKQISIKRNPLDQTTKVIVIRDDNGYHYFPMGLDGSNFIEQTLDKVSELPKP